jgi:hypothetical protein
MPVNIQPPQSHRLQHQHPGVATGGEFGGRLGQRPLLNQSQWPGVFDIEDVFKLFDAWYRATMHVVADDGAILKKVAEIEQQVLREVSDRKNEQRARLINHPGVVRLHVRHFRRHAEPALAGALKSQQLRTPRENFAPLRIMVISSRLINEACAVSVFNQMRIFSRTPVI